MEASFLFFYLITLLFQDNYRHTCSLVSPNGEKLLQYHTRILIQPKFRTFPSPQGPLMLLYYSYAHFLSTPPLL